MPIRRLLQSRRARRAIAASAIALSMGGLVLFNAEVGAVGMDRDGQSAANFANGTIFHGPGASGSFSLSHGTVLADGRQRVFAELRLRADEVDVARERAPVALAILLDTSGSMSGEKMREARQSVVRILRQMDDDDEVALVRYDSRARLVQPAARVGDVRASVISRVLSMESGGGTDIPEAMRVGMSALRVSGGSRVRRVVLVSDGLDSTRSAAEGIARSATDSGVTVSTLGIGLDFDESYMAGVARSGQGNFAFVKDASTLARFLARELTETASTNIEQAVAHIQLPRHLRFVRVVGADARQLGNGELSLWLGSLFGGDERRIVIELVADAPLGAQVGIDTQLSWREVGDRTANIAVDRLTVRVTDDVSQVSASLDRAVWASCISALASVRQLDAAAAYAGGDLEAAERLIDENMSDLQSAAQHAPADVADDLRAQRDSYSTTRRRFKAAAPTSVEGRAAAKEVTETDNANVGRATSF